MDQIDRMAAEAGFGRWKRARKRAGKSASTKSSRRADDPTPPAVTRERLDAARYIVDMTTQLEAVAITAHLDRLAYFLGMAKLESEIFVRTCFALQADPPEAKSGEPKSLS